MEPTDHLFRREAGRMVAALTRIFGIQNLALAEDVVQDAFCRAFEVWKFRGVPENPAAWLMTTAKNRALDILRRERTERIYAPELARLIESESTFADDFDKLFDIHAIRDDQLRMMFSCCHPRLREEAQVGLMLHILCGFSVDEIASAFLSSHAAIEKRITRSKKVLAGSNKLFELSDDDLSARLSAVQGALYQLFNEGYHSASAETAVRSELCREAMRLTAMLLEHPLGATPSTFALAALMCFGAARLPARVGPSGDLSSLFDQDRTLWDQGLVVEGAKLLDLSASGTKLTAYHLEAAIASIHAAALHVEDTDWDTIVTLYTTLYTIHPTPIVALNRAIAVAQKEGAARGLEEIRSISDPERLAAYPFYSAALGELEFRLGNYDAASEHFLCAVTLARSPMERRFLEQRVGACTTPQG